MTKSVLERWVDGVFGRGRRPARRCVAKLRTRLNVTEFEGRVVPTANLFVDFGTLLPTTGLTTSVGELKNSFGSGGLQGPDLENVVVGTSTGNVTLSSSSAIRLLPFASVVSAFDYNGNGIVNGADLTALQTDIVGQISTYYAPFDVSVSVVSNATVSAMRAQMQANNGLSTKKNDAYVLAVGYFYPAADGFLYSIGAASQSLGIAPGNDIVARANQRDDTVAVFAELFTGAFGSAGVKNAVSFVASHEAGHAFGLRHTSRATPDHQLLTGSDIMTTNGGTPAPTQPNRTDNFFTRFTLPYAEPWADGYTSANAYDQLVADPDIGAKPGAAAYVTGTGAHDIITITPSGSGATVTVQPYRDAARTSPIGSAYSYTLSSITNGIVVDAGIGNDAVVITGTLAGTVTVNGGSGNDLLNVSSGVGNFIIFNGGQGSDHAVFGATSRYDVDEVAAGVVNVTRNANTTTQLRGVEVASFNGTAGSDTFAFYGQTGGTLLIAYGQGGDDHAVFGATSRYDVDGIGAGVVNVTRNASATTQLNGVKTVSLFGTAGNDTFAFYRPPTGFATDFHVYGMENTPLPSGGDLLYFAPGNGWASPNAGVVMNSNGRKVTYNGIEKF